MTKKSGYVNVVIWCMQKHQQQEYYKESFFWVEDSCINEAFIQFVQTPHRAQENEEGDILLIPETYS